MSDRQRLRKEAYPLVEAIKTYNWDEAYRRAGALNSLLKDDEYMKDKTAEVFAVRELLRSYYRANEAVFQTRKRMIAIAHNLEDILK